MVLDAYRRRCAITGAKIRPVLQAAHIRPLPAGGEHRLDNGLLLRSDVHTLYDRGYLGIDVKHRLLVSPRLRAEFGNGDQFYAKRVRSSHCLNDELTDRTRISSNGTWTRSSKHPDGLNQRSVDRVYIKVW